MKKLIFILLLFAEFTLTAKKGEFPEEIYGSAVWGSLAKSQEVF